MSEEKLLTISIAAYNVEHYIAKAISSCLSEDINDFIEVLVIDDGSTDQTAQIASKFEKEFPNIVHIVKKQNGGYGSTINTSIPLAHGKYFKLLDGDDWFDKNGLRRLIAALRKTDTDMVITPFWYISDKGGKRRLSSDIKGANSCEYPIDILNQLEYVNMHRVTVKTQILKSLDIKLPEHCFYMDTQFVCTVLTAVESVFVLHTPVYCYRVGRNEQSMSIKGIRKHFSDQTILLNSLFNLYDQLMDKKSGNARILYIMLKRECYEHYRCYCLLQINSKNKKHMIEYDKKLMSRKQLYDQLGQESRVIYFLRKTKFIIYPLTCLLERWKSN